MTSDAKVGLLLGLVFIFIIAFIINGLPSFRSETDNNEDTKAVFARRDDTSALGVGQRKIISEVINPVERFEQQLEARSEPESQAETRWQMELPDAVREAGQTVKAESSEGPQQLSTAKQAEQPKTKPVSNSPLEATIYVVGKGDTLAAIAKKVYGSEAGNKLANIQRIFQANRDKLDSPDQIYEGQKLLIPPLVTSGRSAATGVLDSSLFEKVKSIGARRIAIGTGETKRARSYVVKEGDSLWRIAEEQLGNGSRYTEIARLNASVLEDADMLPVGVRLKLPAK